MEKFNMKTIKKSSKAFGLKSPFAYNLPRYKNLTIADIC